MIKANYLDWEHIFLDTSIVISYLNAVRDHSNQRCAFVKRVIDDLNSTKTKSKKERNFYVSAITISELLDKSADIRKAEKIVKSLNTKSMTFVAFDMDVAEFMTNNYHSVLGTTNLKQIARELSFPEHDILHGRQWLEKDAMIIASAHSMNCDVLLSMDKKTMLPLADKVEYFCAIAESDNFNISDNYIFEYQLGFNKS